MDRGWIEVLYSPHHDTDSFEPVLTSAELEALRLALAGRPGLSRLLGTLRERVAPVLERAPLVPRVKALLSRDGGVCPTDGAPLGFDPWSPDRHACPRCGQSSTGERHHRHWARAQHLWLAERAADLALLAAVDVESGERATPRALELLTIYEDLYFALPNRDNVLGPSHLFFSTYLESLWLTSYLAAAFLLREAGLLPEERIEGVNRVADEAAALIGEFNEGLSNRQTWHATALTAVAVWFGDEELARTAVESRTGLVGHLADGFGEDGMWWEGENYHLFALRGLMLGVHWARAAGYDILEDSAVRDHFRAALLAPSLTALPDCTYPARRDSRYGVSLAQPAYRELGEAGRAWVGADRELDAWIGALYAVPLPLPAAEHYDAWLHDAGRAAPAAIRRTRGDLSWWALAAIGPATAPTDPAPTDSTDFTDDTEGSAGSAEGAGWWPVSVLLPHQGLAVLRVGGSYASLECGRDVGGHGHPDRLHLTLHAAGVHWLPDQGTGSYVQPHLAWYRSALAHNAPVIDGENAGGADAWCEAFEAGEELAWCRARAGEARRTVVVAPTHLVDVVEVQSGVEREVILPWHLQGEITVESPGRFEPATLEHPFVSRVERFFPARDGPIVVSAQAPGSAAAAALCATFLAPGAKLFRAVAPGLPTTGGEQPFLFSRARRSAIRWVTVLDWAGAEAEADRAGIGVRVEGEAVIVELLEASGPVRYQFSAAGLRVESAGTRRSLAGLRPAPPPRRPPSRQTPIPEVEAVAPLIEAPSALDGTLAGFDTSAPLLLDSEHQYRRSEEPYDPERFTARAWVNWVADEETALYLAVEVSKPEVLLRGAGAPPLDLDNEAEDLHSDGLQVYLRHGDEVAGAVVVPEEGGGVRVRVLGDGALAVDGHWSRTDDGYRATLRLVHPLLQSLGPGERIGFDLLVNEIRPERLRRAGQLVWGGDGGWVYLRGDSHDPARFGVLELG